MTEGALFGLVLGFLPVVIIALIVTVILAAVVVGMLFVWLLEQPLVAWFFVGSAIFNAVILIPLWLLSSLVAYSNPEFWQQTDQYVYGFSIGFLVPTAIFFYKWREAQS